MFQFFKNLPLPDFINLEDVALEIQQKVFGVNGFK